MPKTPTTPPILSASALRQMAEVSLHGLALVEPSGSFRYVNPNLARMLGQTVESMIGHPVFEFMDPSLADAASRILAAGLSGKPMRFEFRLRRLDGSDVWCLVSTSPLKARDGKTVEAVIAILHDVTDRTLEEKRRRKSEAMLRESQRLAGIGSWEWYPDSGEIHWSDELFRIFGRDPARGAPSYEELLSYHGEYASRLDACVQRALKQRIPYEYEYEITRPDGTKRWLIGRGETMRDSSGFDVGLRGTAQDIHERKVAELEREKMEAKQRFIYEITQVAAETLDHHQIFQKIADHAVPALADFCIVHVIENEQIAVRAASHRDPARRSILFERATQALLHELGTATSPTVLSITRGSKLIPELSEADVRAMEVLRPLEPRSLLCVPILARGKAIGSLALAQSSSGRRFTVEDLRIAELVASSIAGTLEKTRLYEEAQAAALAREEVLEIVSHDLRNPLSAFEMSLELMTKILEETHLAAEFSGFREKLHRLIQASQISTRRMSLLVRDLLDFSRSRSQILRLHLRECHLQQIVEDVLEVQEPLAKSKGITFEAHVEDDCGATCSCDPDRVIQVLANLVGNAIKFTPAGGRIFLSAHPARDGLEFSVRDTGPGISEEDQKHLFERYWQGPDASHLGMGLGLPIAKSIVDAHEGWIQVESTPGRGSIFRFFIPSASAKASA